MKRIFLLLTLGAVLTCPSFGQSTNTPPPGGHHHGMDFLTDAEKAELKKAHDAAIAADPTLATDEAALKASHQAGTPPSDADKTKWMAFREKMNAAMIKADPAVAPILAKIKAHHGSHGGPGGDKDGHGDGPGAGGPPPPPSDN